MSAVGEKSRPLDGPTAQKNLAKASANPVKYNFPGKKLTKPK
jgi:hypothetical protein